VDVAFSSGWESKSSGLAFFGFSWMLCRIATRRLCTVLGSSRPGEAPLACRSAQRTALANGIPWRTSLSWSSLGTSGHAAAMWSSLLHNYHARTLFGRSLFG